MESTAQLNNYSRLNLTDLEILFSFCDVGIACKDENLKYFYVNNSFCKLFGENDPQAFLGKSNNDYLSESNIKLIKNADLEIKNELFPLNYIINTNSGNILSIYSSPIVKEKCFNGIITIAKDITQEEIIKTKFVNKHFEYINSEKQLQKQRETFVASIGHDLKNPTIAQIRSLELLINGAFGKFNKDQKEILIMILDSCRYMKGMLSSLLDTYRNYGGIIKLNYSEFSMSELVEECSSEMLYVAKDKNLKLIKLINADKYYISADKIQIKRVLMNLLTNAIKYAYANTELILKVSKNADFVHFEFENKSPYIPPETQKKIFARYASFSGNNKELGVGLGLYASKKIIESHGGSIYFKSFEDNRNIFGFNVPETQEMNQIKEVRL